MNSVYSEIFQYVLSTAGFTTFLAQVVTFLKNLLKQRHLENYEMESPLRKVVIDGMTCSCHQAKGQKISEKKYVVLKSSKN